jgi:hypothetical protein
MGLFDHLESDLEDGAVAHDDMRGEFHDAATALAFMRAGKAFITLRSKKTGNRFTYRITIPTNRKTGEKMTDGTLMVSVLTGSDNDSSYTWLGRISREIFWVGRKNPKPGEISKDAPSAVAFDWTWRNLVKGKMPDTLECWHEGRCGRCGRRLTVPESIAQGFGPECVQHVGGSHEPR